MHPIQPNSILNTRDLTVNKLDIPLSKKAYFTRLTLTSERICANFGIRTFYGIAIAGNTFELDHFSGYGKISNPNSLDE